MNISLRAVASCRIATLGCLHLPLRLQEPCQNGGHPVYSTGSQTPAMVQSHAMQVQAKNKFWLQKGSGASAQAKTRRNRKVRLCVCQTIELTLPDAHYLSRFLTQACWPPRVSQRRAQSVLSWMGPLCRLVIPRPADRTICHADDPSRRKSGSSQVSNRLRCFLSVLRLLSFLPGQAGPHLVADLHICCPGRSAG